MRLCFCFARANGGVGGEGGQNHGTQEEVDCTVGYYFVSTPSFVLGFESVVVGILLIEAA